MSDTNSMHHVVLGAGSSMSCRSYFRANVATEAAGVHLRADDGGVGGIARRSTRLLAAIATVAFAVETLTIRVIGVAEVDTVTNRVVSEGGVHLQRLDVLGYATVSTDAQADLAAYAAGELDLVQLVGRIEGLTER